jgi:hypothetical protein
MSYLTFVGLIVPTLIGLVAAIAHGPNRGVVAGAVVMLVAVFVLPQILLVVTRGAMCPGLRR